MPLSRPLALAALLSLSAARPAHAQSPMGRNFDVLTGISGLLLGAWLLRGRPVPRPVVLLVFRRLRAGKREWRPGAPEPMLSR